MIKRLKQESIPRPDDIIRRSVFKLPWYWIFQFYSTVEEFKGHDFRIGLIKIIEFPPAGEVFRRPFFKGFVLRIRLCVPKNCLKHRVISLPMWSAFNPKNYVKFW